MSDLACPLPECGSPLHLVWTMDVPLSTELRVHGADLPVPDDAYTSSWDVRCEEGHVVLVPGPLGCPDHDEDCPDELDFDWSDELRTFTAHDRRRLIRLLVDLRSENRES